MEEESGVRDGGMESSSQQPRGPREVTWRRKRGRQRERDRGKRENDEKKELA